MFIFYIVSDSWKLSTHRFFFALMAFIKLFSPCVGKIFEGASGRWSEAACFYGLSTVGKMGVFAVDEGCLP
jgi:hypothetical protein